MEVLNVCPSFISRALPRDDGVKENSLGRSASDHSSTLVMKASAKTLATSRKETGDHFDPGCGIVGSNYRSLNS